MIHTLFCYLFSTFMFFLYCALVSHCMIINISRKMKKFLLELMTQLTQSIGGALLGNRSSRPEVFLGKGVLKICNKFTGEQSCRSVISVKLQPSRGVLRKRCDSLLRKGGHYTSSIIDNTNNDASECILHFLMRQVLQQQYQITFTLCISQFLALNTFYFSPDLFTYQ